MINVKWKINEMIHNNIDGGIVTIYWECIAQSDTMEYAVEGGKLRCEPNPSSSNYISYNNVTEKDVLGWVYKSLIKDGQTALETKNSIENKLIEKVKSKILLKKSQSSGLPFLAS